jgi:hypothetical protein
MKTTTQPARPFTGPLVATAFVWQGWKLIIASVVAGTAGVGVLFFLGFVLVAMQQTPLLNKRAAAWQQQYETCRSEWTLQGRQGSHFHVCKAMADRHVAQYGSN